MYTQYALCTYLQGRILRRELREPPSAIFVLGLYSREKYWWCSKIKNIDLKKNQKTVYGSLYGHRIAVSSCELCRFTPNHCRLSCIFIIIVDPSPMTITVFDNLLLFHYNQIMGRGWNCEVQNVLCPGPLKA